MTDINAPLFWPKLFEVLWQGTLETLLMVAVSMAITLIVGLPLGIILVGTDRGGFLEAPFGSRAFGSVLHRAISFIVNLGRSVPFIVLMIALIPFTRWLVGGFVGTGPAMVPLTIVAIPFFVRIVEIAVREVDPGLLETADAMGASRWLAVRRVILPEATPGLILGIATTLTSIINFSAMVGVVGGGGLGQVAVTYGQQRYSWPHIVAVIIILFALIQLIQLALTNLAGRVGAGRMPGRRASRATATPGELPLDPAELAASPVGERAR